MSPRHLDEHENTVYVFALGLLKGVGAQNQRALITHFPTLQEFEHASLQQFESVLRHSLASSIYEQVHSSSAWKDLLEQAAIIIQQHLQQEILPIPITSTVYSPLLRQIPDPPTMLYARGNISLLQQDAVAIVGTRVPTPKGVNVARHLARYMVQQQYCIVSGLARGIDTAAHEGTLEANGRTIAVYATPMDTVYPAENKGLAKRILDAGGLVLSEIPLGQKSFRSAFVLRDRIQSGLSLSVIPVQTSIDGGTMHTVKFAKEQARLVACPVPLRDEAHSKQYEGIFSLMKETNRQIYAFRAGQIEESDILTRLQEIRQQLLSSVQQQEKSERKTIGINAVHKVHIDEQPAISPRKEDPPQSTDLPQRYAQETEAQSRREELQESRTVPEQTDSKAPTLEATSLQKERDQSLDVNIRERAALTNRVETYPDTGSVHQDICQLRLIESEPESTAKMPKAREKKTVQSQTAKIQKGGAAARSTQPRHSLQRPGQRKPTFDGTHAQAFPFSSR